jgi:hypothetical protein
MMHNCNYKNSLFVNLKAVRHWATNTTQQNKKKFYTFAAESPPETKKKLRFAKSILFLKSYTTPKNNQP